MARTNRSKTVEYPDWKQQQKLSKGCPPNTNEKETNANRRTYQKGNPLSNNNYINLFALVTNREREDL